MENKPKRKVGCGCIITLLVIGGIMSYIGIFDIPFLGAWIGLMFMITVYLAVTDELL